VVELGLMNAVPQLDVREKKKTSCNIERGGKKTGVAGLLTGK